MKKLYFWRKQYSDGTTEYYVEYSGGKRIVKLTTEHGLVSEVDCNSHIKIIMHKEHDGVILVSHEDELYYLSLKNFMDNSVCLELDKHLQ